MEGLKLGYAGTIYYNGSVHCNKIYPLRLLEVEITLRCPLRCIHCSVGGW